jgi:two-component system response regulator HydG
MKPRVMVIDDLDSARQMVKRALSPACEVYDFASVKEALPALDRAEFDLVLTDLRMPELDGLEGLKRFRQKMPDLPVVLVTAFASVETAVAAMKAGAFDYLKKPFEPEELEVVVERAVEHGRLRRENARLKSALSGEFSVRGIVGKSQGMRDVVSVLERVAPADVPLLVEGESGTGKDVIARAIHGMSRRAGGPYVALNMSAIPENLAESELFGHEKGAFTGADQARAGFFGEAEGGTLFLDEIGTMPLTLQAKMLRVLQDGDYIPVGSRKTRKANVRLVCATNEDMKKAVAEGRFREDLYYRIRVVPLRLPPLRERREDIPALADHFLGRFARLRPELPSLALAPEARDALCAHRWPGNVRELEHALERAVVLAEGPVIREEDLPETVRAAPTSPDAAADADPGEAGFSLKRAVRNVEQKVVRAALERTGGNRTRAAELLGISYRALLYKIKDYGL